MIKNLIAIVFLCLTLNSHAGEVEKCLELSKIAQSLVESNQKGVPKSMYANWPEFQSSLMRITLEAAYHVPVTGPPEIDKKIARSHQAETLEACIGAGIFR